MYLFIKLFENSLCKVILETHIMSGSGNQWFMGTKVVNGFICAMWQFRRSQSEAQFRVHILCFQFLQSGNVIERWRCSVRQINNVPNANVSFLGHDAFAVTQKLLSAHCERVARCWHKANALFILLSGRLRQREKMRTSEDSVHRVQHRISFEECLRRLCQNECRHQEHFLDSVHRHESEVHGCHHCQQLGVEEEHIRGKRKWVHLRQICIGQCGEILSSFQRVESGRVIHMTLGDSFGHFLDFLSLLFGDLSARESEQHRVASWQRLLNPLEIGVDGRQSLLHFETISQLLCNPFSGKRVLCSGQENYFGNCLSGKQISHTLDCCWWYQI